MPTFHNIFNNTLRAFGLLWLLLVA